MPEGDALHRAARRLQPLVGERIEAESPSPQGEATGVAREVDGRVLESVDAIGKHLLLRFEGGVVLRSHLRMNGRWRIAPRGTTRGRPWLVLRGGAWEATQWNGPVLTLERRPIRRLGPDLLADDTVVADVVLRVRRASQARVVGETLVDQRIVAGIGNMWVAEALWQARVSPWSPLGTVTDDELTRVLAWAQDAMRAAVASPRGPRAVYRRAGRPCSRCGTAIASRGLGDANRTAYWCPACQPERVSR
ncbi:MAG TPA: DNA-formamidopyrimidine glycosylase family protein [Gaiella sp.]|jgi:endonuclease-8|nr:DNA-formamidopyrimidine glycosylase family protein [Gaiella sp.]